MTSLLRKLLGHWTEFENERSETERVLEQAREQNKQLDDSMLEVVKSVSRVQGAAEAMATIPPPPDSAVRSTPDDNAAADDKKPEPPVQQ